ncbi:MULTISPECIES: STAS domain-containing protein [Streptomyces]|uniref:Anti-sigma factor antagonist n=1 Tax=Streptomyces katrae TaxID=68223 RepID=A0ABT7H282_9ACTN|nr:MULTISPECIES: STAS domain-containing protein [Streptomyces]MDK9499574.1 STAS domain-containing protein [Streptomyces katrae]RST00760.1 anti-sigma factor antagonist [Streptomyces sp. WAC07149]GLX17545.1 anti-sigma factor antagonist [Streptomyces lavendulae subsp. lavendulae]GLX24594.1 anti-sigma factor antagonist [Streptomyces lavendulae subsp. lavendulae]
MVSGADDKRFTVAVRAVDGVVLLTLGGELDHDTAGPLKEALDAAAHRGGRLLVDMAGLRFCDSTGLNALLHGRLAVQEAGGSLELAGLTGPVARMFRITGADGVFPVHADVTQALGANQGR